MQRGRVLAGIAFLLGGASLYVAWANASGLLPPFALCGYVGDPTIHVGESFALVYNGGCAPYEFAYLTFTSVTIVGFAFIGGSIRLNRRYR